MQDHAARGETALHLGEEGERRLGGVPVRLFARDVVVAKHQVDVLDWTDAHNMRYVCYGLSPIDR